MIRLIIVEALHNQPREKIPFHHKASMKFYSTEPSLHEIDVIVSQSTFTVKGEIFKFLRIFTFLGEFASIS